MTTQGCWHLFVVGATVMIDNSDLKPFPRIPRPLLRPHWFEFEAGSSDITVFLSLWQGVIQCLRLVWNSNEAVRASVSALLDLESPRTCKSGTVCEGCFQRRLTEEGRAALNVGDTSSRSGAQNEEQGGKGESQIRASVPTLCFLMHGDVSHPSHSSSCHESNQASPPRMDWAFLNQNQNKSFLL